MDTQDTQLLEELASIAEQYTVNAPKEVFRAFPNWAPLLLPPLQGLWLEPLERPTGDALGLTGVVITEIAPGGLAAKSKKLRTGDVVHVINGRAVTTPKEAATLLREAYGTVSLVVTKASKSETLESAKPRLAGLAYAEMAIRMTRNSEGIFGLVLNDANRVTHVAEGSGAARAGLKPFDLVTHVDEVPLVGSIAPYVEGKVSVRLGIERPPAALYNQISAAENAPDEKQVLTEIAKLWGGDSKTQKRALSPPRSLSPDTLLQLNESPSRMRMAAE